MRISYVTTSTPNIASYRYRVLSPTKYLEKKGFIVQVDRVADPRADIVVFGKHWNSNDWSYAQFCRKRGQRVIFDVCDDHFGHQKYSAHYYRMASVAHLISVNSEAMVRVVEENTSRQAVYIPDPVLTKQVPYDPEKLVSLLWYGQRMNLQGLLDVYPKGCKTPLEIVTLHPFELPEKMRHGGVTLSPWHEDCIQEAAIRNSAALLPYRQERPAKSANRVLEALNCGLPVITDRIPAVASLGYSGIFDLQHDLMETIRSLEVLDLSEDMRIVQKMISLLYSEEAVGKQWEKFFTESVWREK
jgi:hypothetical protein